MAETTITEAPEAADTATGAQLPLFPFEGISPGDDYVAQYEDYRRQCPVPKVRLANGGEAYVVMRHADTRRVLAEPVFDREGCMDPSVPLLLEGSRIPGLLVNIEGREHLRQRKLTVRAFTPGKVAQFRPRIEQIADALVDAMLEQGPPADFVTSFGTPFPARLIFEIFGVPTADIGRLMDWLTKILSFGRFTPEEQGQAFQEVTAYFAALVARKRAEPGDDLTSALIQARDGDDKFTDEELVSNIWVNVSGGTVASSNILPNMIATFSQHPDQWELLKQRPELIPNAVEEVLRYVAAATTSFERITTEPVELSGTALPAGSVLIPLLSSANFDAEAYREPERFDVTRKLESPHLGYGHGPHRCVGAPLGTAELEVALEVLLARMPNLRVAIPHDQLPWDEGVAMRRLVCLPVTW